MTVIPTRRMTARSRISGRLGWGGGGDQEGGDRHRERKGQCETQYSSGSADW